MKPLHVVPLGLATLLLGGCHLLGGTFCEYNCQSSRASSSLVGFLYPDGAPPPPENSIPELKVPLRVGISFLPSKSLEDVQGLEAARRAELLERIRRRFAERRFIAELVVVPDYYLRGSDGFASLEGVQRLYNLDCVGLVSYDQVVYAEDNGWSLGYLTIVGAYVLKGSRHDITTLVDLAVVEARSRSILLRAGGTDTRHGTSTLAGEGRDTRESQAQAWSNATDQLIDHFDVALTQFEADVKSGKANVRVTQRNAAGTSGGGGAIDGGLLLLAASALALRRRRVAA